MPGAQLAQDFIAIVPSLRVASPSVDRAADRAGRIAECRFTEGEIRIPFVGSQLDQAGWTVEFHQSKGERYVGLPRHHVTGVSRRPIQRTPGGELQEPVHPCDTRPRRMDMAQCCNRLSPSRRKSARKVPFCFRAISTELSKSSLPSGIPGLSHCGTPPHGRTL